MKKQFLVLAGSALLLASCGGKTEPAGQTQAQIDSAINAKVAQHDAEVAAKNDSTLKAVEKEKAEAEARAREHHGEKKHEEAAQAAPAPAPAPAPATNPKESRFSNDQNKPAVDPASTKKKEDRFK